MINYADIMNCIHKRNFESITDILGYDIQNMYLAGTNNQLFLRIFYLSIVDGENSLEYKEFFEQNFANYPLEYVFSSSVNDFHVFYKMTPLMLACRANNLELVKYLIDSGANVNSKPEFADVLICAITSKSIDIIEFLLANGAKVYPIHFFYAAEQLYEKDTDKNRCLSMLMWRWEIDRGRINICKELFNAGNLDELDDMLKILSREEQRRFFNEYQLFYLSILNTNLNILCVALIIPALISIIIYAAQYFAENFKLIGKAPRNLWMFFCFGEKQQIEMRISKLPA